MGWLTGKNKTKVVDGVIGAVTGIGKFIDEQKFTTEEAAIFNKGTAEASAQFVKDTLGEGTERSRSRRKIGVRFVSLFPWIVIGIIALRIVENYVPTIAGSAEFAKGLIIAMYLPAAFITIIAFFFGGYYLKQYTGQKKK